MTARAGPERCIPNIGPRERRKRLAVGVAAWGAAVVGLGVLLAIDAGRGWRLALALPLWAGSIGFFQHREKT